MHSLRTLHLVTAISGLLGLIALEGPVTADGVPQFLLLILLFFELAAIAGLLGAIMTVQRIRRTGYSHGIALAGVACVLFAIAFGLQGLSGWNTYIDTL